MPSRRQSKPVPSGLRAAQTRIRHARESYVKGVLDGSIPAPAPGTPEAKSLASLASKARWGKAPKAMKKLSRTTGISPRPEASNE
jgi:hypothetical protein